VNTQKGNIFFTTSEIPARLRELANPPAQLFCRGTSLADLLARPCVAIVGSRKVTTYGRTVTEQLASELARQGVVIISGLAVGVDGIAHRAALAAGGLTIAVLPCGLERIYPASHRQLAEDIVKNGGALVTEYAAGAIAYKLNFIARNRIVAGLADAVLVTEAALKSGTLHTARFALEQGKDVLAVPGNINSPTSEGTNNLIRSGAALVASATDVLQILGLDPTTAKAKVRGSTPAEQLILDFLVAGLQDGSALLAATGLSAASFNQALTMLEISGSIRALGGNQWALR